MSWRFSLTSCQSSASGGAGLRSTIGFQILASSAFSGMKSFWSAGTSSSAKIASTGHSATQSVQSMHSSGSMTSMFGPSRKQSTGQTSTQSVYLHFTQDSVTTYVICAAFQGGEGTGKKTAILTPGPCHTYRAALPGTPVLVYDYTISRPPGSLRTPL